MTRVFLASRNAKKLAEMERILREHDEIGAWVCEVDTWTALVDQNWPRAAELATAGEDPVVVAGRAGGMRV